MECPKCGSPQVHRSRSRSLFDRWRKLHSAKRLFRCDLCGWRGWTLPMMDAEDSPLEVAVADFNDIDQAFDRRARDEPE